MSAAQVADALGVRPATVYAYVSRGVLRRTTAVTPEGQRVSVFDRDEVLALAAQRARPRAGVIGTLIESDVTELDPRGRLAFRGIDVADLVGRGFEEAVAVLWNVPAAWPPLDPAIVGAAHDGLSLAGTHGAVIDPRDRILLAVAHAATADSRRGDVDRDHVLAVARSAIQVSARATAGPLRVGETTAAALWRALTGRTPSPEQRAALDAALVVLMDHELAASTLAARVAASTGADPWLCLLAGLATLRGPRHGGASGRATRLLRRWLADCTVGLEAPSAGFGHPVYEGIDPRAEILLSQVALLDPALVDEIDALIVAVAREHSLLPNVDFGLAALAVAGGLPDEAGECVFMVSRIAGFAAHILEEYPHGLRFRPRAVSAG